MCEDGAQAIFADARRMDVHFAQLLFRKRGTETVLLEFDDDQLRQRLLDAGRQVTEMNVGIYREAFRQTFVHQGDAV